MFVINNDQMRKSELSCSMDYYELMERAGKAIFDFILNKYDKCKVLIMCGSGNNGGDGFVLARLLKENNWNVSVAVQGDFKPLKNEIIRAVKNFGVCSFLELEACSFEEYDLIIDALFGIGLSRDISEDFRDVSHKINICKSNVLSVDIPSGINGNNGSIMGAAIKADDTVTFSAFKVGHVLHPGKSFSGNVTVVDIGVPIQEYIAQINDSSVWINKINYPNADSNKYDRGYVAVFGGDVTLMGAAKLAAYGALRTFAGIVSIVCEEPKLELYASSVTSIILKTPETIFEDPRVGAFVVGPGNGIKASTLNNTLLCLERHNCVIDADALSVFSDNPSILFNKIHQCGHNVVLTPHYGEFKRIFKFHSDSKIELTKKAAEISGAVVILKGDDTVIASPDGRVVVNYGSVPQLATAGSGDVLAGIVAALIASKVDAFNAACAGVWIHTEAARKYGIGLISEDLPFAAGDAVSDLFDLYKK